MRKRRKTILGLLVLTFVLLFSSMTTQAASSKWTKACKAYRNYLKKNESHYTPKRNGYWFESNKEKSGTISAFLIADLDKNGVPELIASHANGMKDDSIYVFTYKNGKVIRVKNTKKKNVKINAKSYTGGGETTVDLCKKNHLHIGESWGSGYHRSTYKMKSGKMVLYAEYEWNRMEMRTTIKVNGKAATQNKYNSVAGCEMKVKKSWVDNKEQNRRKYVK